MTLKSQAIKGVKWTTLSTVLGALFSIIKLSILARLLDKSDFGLMALVMFVLGFMNLFMDLGLSSAILHKQNINKKEYASLYWLNVFFSIILFGLIVLIAPYAAIFYEEPELIVLLRLMALSLLLSALGRQFKTIEQKELNFRFMALVEISSVFFALVLAIFLAYMGYGVYALVYSALLQYLLSNSVFLINGLYKKGLLLHFKYAETKPFLKIGIYQVGGQVINYFNRDLDTLIVGKLLGTEVLGGYNLAKQLVFRPFSIINPVLTKVAAPSLAKIQHDAKALKESYLKLVNSLATISTVVYAGLMFFAKPAVFILYGEEFLDIVILVQILSVYMIVRSIGNPVASLVIAKGRTDVEFKWNVFTFFIFPLAVFSGSQFGIIGVAVSLGLMMILLIIPSWYLMISKLIDVSLRQYLYAIIPFRNISYMTKIVFNR